MYTIRINTWLFVTLMFLFAVIGIRFNSLIQEVEIDKQNRETQLVIPSNMKPINGLLTNTSFIGTRNNPTINGGIINAPNVMLINHAAPVKLQVELQPIKAKLFQPINPVNSGESNYVTPFQDNWATSIRVKEVLEEAARSGKLDYVLKQADKMKIPASVATIPIVESNYQDDAISPKGAAGAWQLMPSTAHDYGLSDTDRFEFYRSTTAALILLSKLHKEFGNWELAFAAYNVGAKRVEYALRKNPSAKSIEQLDLPVETKNYVRKIMQINKSLVEL